MKWGFCGFEPPWNGRAINKTWWVYFQQSLPIAIKKPSSMKIKRKSHVGKTFLKMKRQGFWGENHVNPNHVLEPASAHWMMFMNSIVKWLLPNIWDKGDIVPIKKNSY